MKQYIALIHKDADSDYGVSFPDLPGVISAGSTLDEARDMATEALALHIEGLIEDGEAIPEPCCNQVEMSRSAQSRNVTRRPVRGRKTAPRRPSYRSGVAVCGKVSRLILRL